MTTWLERVMENPVVYRLWQAPFAQRKFAPVERQLGRGTIGRVLDVGCGPGTNAARFAGGDYTGIDINAEYLTMARATYQGRFVQADLAVEVPPGLGSFDTIIVNSFLHHLPDTAVANVLAQLRTLLAPEGRVHILELVIPTRFSLATPMARMDRGRYARTLAAWQKLFDATFETVVFEPYHFGGGLWAMVYFQGKGPACGSR